MNIFHNICEHFKRLMPVFTNGHHRKNDPRVRLERVHQLKLLIDAGIYEPNIEGVASAMIEKEAIHELKLD